MWWRGAALSWSTAFEAARMVVAVLFEHCTFCICSSSAPEMFLDYDRTRRVGNIACVASYAFRANGDMCLLLLSYVRRLCIPCMWVC